MASKKKSALKRPGTTRTRAAAAASSARSTVGGPSRGATKQGAKEPATARSAAVDALAAAIPSNRNKPDEYGSAASRPPRGATAKPEDVRATASTLTETVSSQKAG